jgi:hypothetical protein
MVIAVALQAARYATAACRFGDFANMGEVDSRIGRPSRAKHPVKALGSYFSDNELISNVGGNIKVSNLIQRAYEARPDLDEGDEEWIVAIRNRGTTSLRRRHLGRLKRCCIQLGELEPHIGG